MALSDSVDMIDPAPGSIQLWLTDPDAIGKELLASYAFLLNTEEKEQYQRFHFERDRRRYLVTRALVRTVLSRYAPVAPRDWFFATNEYGCPRIDHVHEAITRICFNLSHTHNLIVLAVSRDRALGVDIENVWTREVSSDIAERFFAPDEVEALHTLEADYRQERFFEYWTFKESYIKARGMGLSLSLDLFTFDLSRSGLVTFRVSAELGDHASRWQFWQFRPGDEYIVALCAERSAECAIPVSVIQTIPLMWYKQQQFSFSRISMREASHAEFHVV